MPTLQPPTPTLASGQPYLPLPGFPQLCLRPHTVTDAPAYAAAVQESVTTLSPWLPWCSTDYNEHHAQQWIAQCASMAAQGSAHELGIYPIAQEGSAPVSCLGGAGLNLIQADRSQCNLGYWVRSSWQRQGLASACVQALQTLAFDVLHMQRVEIIVAVGNEASYRVASRSGAINEGVRSGCLVIRNVPHEAWVFSLPHPPLNHSSPAAP